MGCRAVVVYDDALTDYDFGRSHPLAPIRLELTMRLARSLDVLDAPEVTVLPPSMATPAELALVHDPDYIEVVRRLSARPVQVDLRRGLGTSDNPVFGGMHEVTALVVGATLTAARNVWAGDALHGLNISGGLHHAMAGHASGFCIYNDPAIAIQELLLLGAERVAYVDIDAHHGDGVQAAFYDDPRVLTISIHESPYTLFPGTGFASDTGGPNAPGSAVNIPVPAGTGDAEWLAALLDVVPPRVADFRPDILVSQHGCDSHVLDPLTHLRVTVDAQRVAHQALHDLAHEVCDGRWLATGGGGYSVYDAVPRSWTHLIAVVTGRPLPATTAVPPEWSELVEEVSGGRRPGATLSDLGDVRLLS